MSAVDNFQSYQTSLNSPAVAGVAVTTSDSTDLVNVSRAVHVTGTGGLVYVTMSEMTTGTSVPLYIAHHIIPLDVCTEEQKFDPNNLKALCTTCHPKEEAEATQPLRPHVTGMLSIVEDETYYFDAEAADKPIRFIEKFCIHTEGKAFIGKPFLLEPIQKQIIRDVYGWKNRITGLRRFNRVWWEGAVGSGKSPTLSACGVFEIVAGDEPGNQLFCMAADYAQAKVIFDGAKAFIKANPLLVSRCEVRQYEIRCKSNGNIWRIISGKGPKAGTRPGIVFGDECHQWKSAECYNDIQGRMAKRAEPIIWIATNAAESSSGIYWQLHEEAIDLLSGKKKDDHLYPVIWAADENAAIDDPEQWKKANPLMGITVREDKIREEMERAKGSPALEARFKRLYMGLHVQGVNKWINLEYWKAAQKPVDTTLLKSLPLFVGWDGSQGDDLCSAVFVWCSAERYHVHSRFWLPRSTAEKYQKSDGHQYSEWAEANDITLLDESTISPAVQTRIANEIIAAIEGNDLHAFAYDRYKADTIVAAIEAVHPKKCFPVAQGYSLSTGCSELERRLKDGSITIHPNNVLDFCAANVEVVTNQHGQLWPQKGSRQKRSLKIDGVVSMVCAITEAQKQNIQTTTTQHVGAMAINLDD